MSIGKIGAASMMKFYKKEDFILEKVPSYALLLKEDDGVRVWDFYGNEEAFQDQIQHMIKNGWKNKRDFKRISSLYEHLNELENIKDGGMSVAAAKERLRCIIDMHEKGIEHIYIDPKNEVMTKKDRGNDFIP